MTKMIDTFISDVIRRIIAFDEKVEKGVSLLNKYCNNHLYNETFKER